MNPRMKNICILDFGNTRVKWAVFKAGKLQQVLSDEEAWRTLETWDEDAQWLIAATGVVDEQWQGWLDALKVRTPPRRSPPSFRGRNSPAHAIR